jgi:hypothetical protein
MYADRKTRAGLLALFLLCLLVPNLPGGEVFQLENVHGLRVAGGTQEL